MVGFFGELYILKIIMNNQSDLDEIKPGTVEYTVKFKSVEEFDTRRKEIEKAFTQNSQEVFVVSHLELPDRRRIEKNEGYVKFFIGDLQEAILKMNNFFELKNQKFKIVDIVGTITRYYKLDCQQIIDGKLYL